jgi:hypothetical protein
MLLWCVEKNVSSSLCAMLFFVYLCGEVVSLFVKLRILLCIS